MTITSADDIFSFILFYDGCIFIRISLKFVPMGPPNNKPASVQVTAK